MRRVLHLLVGFFGTVALTGACGVTSELSAPDASLDGGGVHADDDAGCPSGGAPLCCVDTCGNDLVAEPECRGGGWACPSGSVSCPNNSCTLTADPYEAQRNYAYPGCDAETGYCPNDRTVVCALESIRQKHGGCTVDGDCSRASVEKRCTGWGDCPPRMINADAGAAFVAEAQAEIDRYCPDGGGCYQSGLCAFDPSEYQPRCIAGRCEARRADGGF